MRVSSVGINIEDQEKTTGLRMTTCMFCFSSVTSPLCLDLHSQRVLNQPTEETQRVRQIHNVGTTVAQLLKSLHDQCETSTFAQQKSEIVQTRKPSLSRRTALFRGNRI